MLEAIASKAIRLEAIAIGPSLLGWRPMASRLEAIASRLGRKF